MEKNKIFVCKTCGNSVSQHQLPDGNTYFYCPYCEKIINATSINLEISNPNLEGEFNHDK